MDTRVHRRRALAVALAGLLLPIVAGSVAAAPTPKLDICHLDQVLLTYSRVTISQNSLAKHLAHGDGLPGDGDFDANCQPVPPPARVFALAFTDVDGNHIYDESTDVLIAKLVDTNGDDAVSIGDTITTNQYPLGFDFATAGYGTFGDTSHTVAGVNAVVPGNVIVTSTEGTFLFYGKPDYPSDIYWEFNTTTNATARIQDAQTPYPDYISVWGTPPSVPDTEVELGPVDGGGDDRFIDVILDLP